MIFIDLWNRPFIVANYCQPLGTEIDTNQQQNSEYVNEVSVLGKEVLEVT